jgi:site-specific recombinase XerD
MDAILAAPDLETWNGLRDQVMLATLYNTGARVSELIALRRCDVDINHTGIVRLHGKGRKERVIPLWKNTAMLLRKWLAQAEDLPHLPIFPNRYGKCMTRSSVEDRLKSAIKRAEKNCAALKNKKITPHVIRHTTAMHLLQSGVDLTVIALWLGHESITTTHHYIEADLKMKKRALQSVQEPNSKFVNYVPSDKLLSFLESL